MHFLCVFSHSGSYQSPDETYRHLVRYLASHIWALRPAFSTNSHDAQVPLPITIPAFRLRTDIQFAKLNGLQSLLVLTGNGSLEEVERMKTAHPNYIPDFYCSKLGDLAKF